MTNATLHTNHGVIDIELYPDNAPKTVENFEKLVKDGFYDGLKFHRVIHNFMIQGCTRPAPARAAPATRSRTSPTTKRDERGALSMANAGPNTNGSQFFITHDAQPWLDGKHTVFGRVTDGMDVVDAISGVDRDPGDKPVDAVVIERVEFGS